MDDFIPVPRAIATLAIPTIISQVVTMIYNLADTFFVGQIGNPYMVAAVSLVSPWFNLLTALGNLFGLGGGSLISRMLGKQNHKDIRNVSAYAEKTEKTGRKNERSMMPRSRRPGQYKFCQINPTD